MKILVFSDFHGSLQGVQLAARLTQELQPYAVAICGDIFGGFSHSEQIAQVIKGLDAVTYLIQGNNDRFYDSPLLGCNLQDYEVTYKFSRTLFFTHGHKYNGYKVPPILGKGDVLVYGHTHVGRIWRNERGIILFNVGSLSQPRDGTPCYGLLDDDGLALCSSDKTELLRKHWTDFD